MRSAGVLLHPTSLSSPHGTGDFGAEARRFVDWLARAGAKLWQVLPLVPPGAGDSPYSSMSAFALSPWLIDLRQLGLDVPGDRVGGTHLNADAMRAFKGGFLLQAAKALIAKERALVDAFTAANAWVQDYALFVALKSAHGGAPFFRWPAPLRDREAKAIAAARVEHREAIEVQIALQCLADRQWQSLRAYARERGISIVGDVPIYVDHDSADVWCERDAFLLDPGAKPLAVAGVPPDYFSETGQLWGNPLYDWEALKRSKHGFWTRRMRRMYEICDIVRIDHFRAFSAYWSVPAGAKDARSGEWKKGPGRAVFDDVFAAIGPREVIAEDLGTLDDDVHALRDGLLFPGMSVLQFAFGADQSNAYLPHNHTKRSVVYSGTHDNDTTLGWWKTAGDKVQDHVRRYYGIDGHDIAWALTRSALASVAERAVVPLQDLLKLDQEARMNTPGAATGNWSWRLSNDPPMDVADRFAGLVALYGR